MTSGRMTRMWFGDSGLIQGLMTELELPAWPVKDFNSVVHTPYEETVLYWKDKERVPAIIEKLESCGADLIGLTEVWDPQIMKSLIEGLKDVYPYHCASPTGHGIEAAVYHLRNRHPVLAWWSDLDTEPIVRVFSQGHYRDEDKGVVDGIKKFLGWDRLALVHAILGFPVYWGAGLLLLSRYPLEDDATAFCQHPKKVGLERFTSKGVLRTRVHLSERSRATVMLTHLQEGPTPSASRARKRQLKQISKLIKAARPDPVLVMGDFNIIAEAPNGFHWRLEPTPEYLLMKDILGLQDSYRSIFPNAEDYPGITVSSDHPAARNLGVDQAYAGPDRRIDMIWYSPHFQTVGSEIPENYITEGDQLSDHFPLAARFYFGT